MKVFIVGAGAVASVLAKELAKEKSVVGVVCSSNHIAKAREFIKEGGKISIVEVDASDIHDIKEKAHGSDLLINASLPHFNINVMAAALDIGANYQDLDSELLDLRNPEQFEFEKKYQKGRAVGLINAGISPGMTNLFIAEACDNLDSVHEIKIRGLEEQKAKEFIFTWSPHVTIDELKARPLVLINGKFELAKPLKGEEDYVFPGKYGGKFKVYDVYGDEISTIPKYIKVKNMSYKAGGSDIEFSKILNDAKMLSDEPIEISGIHIAPIEFLSRLLGSSVPTPEKIIELMKKGIIIDGVYIASIECIGKKKGKNVNIRYDLVYPTAKEVMKKCPGATYISYATGIAAAVFAMNIDAIKKKGVFPAEALEKPVRTQIIKDLKKKGVKITKRISYI